MNGPLLVSAAIQDYESARQHNENDRQVKEGLEKAQRLLKQSKKRDYYKILGVKRYGISPRWVLYAKEEVNPLMAGRFFAVAFQLLADSHTAVGRGTGKSPVWHCARRRPLPRP